MTAAVIFSIIGAVLVVAAFVKVFMTVVAQDRCMITDPIHYMHAPDFLLMLINLRKWTFAQHYPELAKRSKQ